MPGGLQAFAGDSIACGELWPERSSLEVDYAETAHMNCLIDSLPAELTDAERINPATLICSNAYLFSRSESHLGLTNLILHTLNTRNHKPIKETLRRHPQASLPLIDEFVNGLLERRCRNTSSFQICGDI